MNPDLTFSGQINDGTAPLKWNDMTLPPLRSMTKAERVANFVYDFVQAGSVPEYNTAGAVTHVVNKTAKTVTETIALVPWDAEKIAAYKTESKTKIDQQADTARLKYVSVGVYTQQEYLQAETDAKAWLLDTSKPCPLSISCWAQAKGWTNEQAATDIVTTAGQFRGLLDNIRAIRLLGKAAVDGAVDGVGVDLAMTTVEGQFAQLP
jgi:hypothetical protein